MKAISDIPLRKFTKEDLLGRLRKECICVGSMYQEKLAAFGWANLQESTFEGSWFVLEANEAYLFDAFSLLDFRGKCLASLACYHL